MKELVEKKYQEVKELYKNANTQTKRLFYDAQLTLLEELLKEKK
jgi:hypothetical protein